MIKTFKISICASTILGASFLSSPAYAEVPTPDGEVTCSIDGAGNISCTEGGDVVVTGTATAGVTLTARPGFSVDGTPPTLVVDLNALEPLATFVDGAPGIHLSAGAGGIDLTVTGDIYTSGTFDGANFADGVSLVTSDGGDILANIDGEVTTLGDDAYGIFAFSDGAVDLTVTGEVYTEGFWAPGIRVNAETEVSVVCADVRTSGDSADAINARSKNDTVSITCGDISTQGANARGVNVVTSSIDGTDGSASITTGVVTTLGDGSRAVSASAVMGDLTASIGGASVQGEGTNAIHFTTDAGNIDVLTQGGVSAADGTALFLFTRSGSVALETQGDISGTTGVAINQSGGASVTIGGMLSATAGNALESTGGSTDVIIRSGGSLVGSVQLTDANDTITVEAGGALDLSSANGFGAGMDSINNDGTFSLADGMAPAGLETFNNTGNGMFLVGPGLTLFQELMGFTNAGTISAGSDATLQTSAALQNSGTIDLSEGNTLNTLTIEGDYVGSGSATVVLDYAGTGADQLRILGNAAGVTTIVLNQIVPVSSDAQGLVLVNADSADADAFVLDGSQISALLQFGLIQNGGQFSIIAAPNEQAFEPAVLPALLYGMDQASSSAVFDYLSAAHRDGGFGSWGNVFAAEDELGDVSTVSTVVGATTLDQELETVRYGLQGGFDWISESGGLLVGVTLGYQSAESEFEGSANEIETDGWNVGVYARLGTSGLDEDGLSATFLVRTDWNDVTLDSVAFQGLELEADSTSAEGRVAYRMGVGGSVRVALDAGISWRKQEFDGFTADMIDYGIGDASATHGSVGARVSLNKGIGPYVAARWNQEFDASGTLSATSNGSTVVVDTLRRGDWGRVELGIEGGTKARGPMVSVWADFGDVEGFGVTAGLRF
ncbi:autotransporter domain-containing protein [Altererythrobacter sp. GH1-8]|uniref:autotransporter domain-containing protein n=1 Tax=Altererythrobacter sp. GH1-8 TaxID=3349333 RepID=UPI00374DF173